MTDTGARAASGREVRLAVLLTCFNRKQETLDCLARLEKQALPPGVALEVFLVDDGSSDGTGEAVEAAYPQVNVHRADGSLFWCRGMHRAWEVAVASGSHIDHFVMLNDDTVLDEHAIEALLAVQPDSSDAEKRDKPLALSIGLVRNPATGRVGYGAFGRASRWNPLKVELLQPDDEREPVAMNGNCVLVPRAVTDQLGFVDPVFHHRFGDMDLAQRVRKAGVELRCTTTTVGSCPPNPHSDVANHARSMSFRRWLQHLSSPKGINPREWAVYSRRHGGPLWPVLWLKGYSVAVLRWPLARLVRS